ncbi:hypothetical protein NP493_185g00006 [Ridgeia piscesae]|uniref:Uncharacterized protein n=1 Tax=Ridgeia piscesae TaxID=27915 RepID=A0AAD9P2C6_RIDPI|nr:hypothetical protein NP493_185g00006 [Ridgeia piscesae]
MRDCLTHVVHREGGHTHPHKSLHFHPSLTPGVGFACNQHRMIITTQCQRHVNFCQADIMTQRDHVPSVLCRHNSRNLCHRQYIAFLRPILLHQLECLMTEQHFTRRHGNAFRFWFVAHLHHGGATVLICVCKSLSCSRRARSYDNILSYLVFVVIVVMWHACKQLVVFVIIMIIVYIVIMCVFR